MVSPFQPLPDEGGSTQSAGTSPVDDGSIDVYGDSEGKDVNADTGGEGGGGSPLLGAAGGDGDPGSDFDA